MAKYASFKQYERALKKAIKDAITTDVLKALGEQQRVNIILRTQDGRGVNENDGPEVGFKSIKDSTVKVRRSKKVKRKLSSNTTPETSNYTRTGKTLNAMKVKVSKQKGLIRIGYFRGKPVVAVKANIKRGFQFLLVSREELKKLAIVLKDALNFGLKKSGL